MKFKKLQCEVTIKQKGETKNEAVRGFCKNLIRNFYFYYINFGSCGFCSNQIPTVLLKEAPGTAGVEANEAQRRGRC